MKKKKRENHSSRMALSLCHLIFLLRRRRQFFPLISALSGCILLVFVAFSLFSSPPAVINHRQRHYSRHHLSVRTLTFFSPSHLTFLPFFFSFLLVFYACCDLTSFCVSFFFVVFMFSSIPQKPRGRMLHFKFRKMEGALYENCGGQRNRNSTTVAVLQGISFNITDAVVAAYILNATLVVPKLDDKSFWKDSSNFAEIFDVDWFISFLSRDVEIIKRLPTKQGKVLTPHNMRVPRKCSPTYYESHVLPVLNKKHAVQLTKFDYRLSNKLDIELQKLRCRVNYHALRFTPSITEMGKMLLERMRMKTKHFITVHLRFEPDMLAFSGCYYGGGDKEREELGAIRKQWKNLHVSNPDRVRRLGRCPLTPEEVGLMLRALGFGSDVHLYVASGEVYGGEETLAPLKALFPNLHSKDTIASKDELEPFSSFSSRMAALDFIVCDESDVFVTNNNGNMARILAGRRRYFGHKPTIRPNAKKLNRLFMDRKNMTWEQFASKVRSHQVGFMGEPNEVKPGRGEFHENPTSCICEDTDTRARELLTPENQTSNHTKIGEESNPRKDASVVTDDQLSDNEQEWFEVDYAENEEILPSKELPTESSFGNNIKREMEEYFSD